MTAERTVKVRVEADTDDALRKLREVARVARRTRRAMGGRSRFMVILDLLLSGFAIGYGLVGMLRHDTFLVAVACMFFLIAAQS